MTRTSKRSRILGPTESYPRQQGLKPQVRNNVGQGHFADRVLSKTTRIETYQGWCGLRVGLSTDRVLSKTTRIETFAIVQTL